MTRRKFILKEYLWVTVGVGLLALGFVLFLIPNKIVTGGVSGIAIILYHLYGLPVGVVVLLLNVVLFAAGFWLLGGGFGWKSIYATVVFAGLIDFFQYVVPLQGLTNDLLIAVIFGNLLGGIGMAIVFNQDSSTGGTDILARLLSRMSAMDIGKSLLIFDFSIAAAAGLLLNSLDIGMYSLLAVIVNTLVIDEFIGTFNNKKSIIISRYPEEIIQRIFEELDRGVTILHGTGAFERREQKVILTVVNRRQVVKIRNIVQEIDPQGFLIIATVTEVLGEGFRKLKH